MPTYRYEASGANGKVTAGHIQAADLKSASEQLRARGEYILSLTPVEAVGRQIVEEILAVASGKKTKSELNGVGEEEFAPWQIGPTL